MYRPRQYVECQSSPGCRVSQRPSGNKRKSKHSLRDWQYGDAPCPRAYSGWRGTAANHRGNIRWPISRASSPRTARFQELRRNARYKELATAKKSGYGTNCKYYRCTTNDPCYARHNPKLDKTVRRIAKTEIKTSVGSPVREIYYERDDEDENANENEDKDEDKDDVTMEEGEEPRNPEQDCSETSCEDDSTGVMVEKTRPIRGGTTCDTGLRSLTMKTVACNTDGSCYHSCYYHPEVLHQLLKDVDNSVEPFHKPPALPLPREKPLVPTPLPRVALLRPPRPASHQIITRKEREMIKYALQKKQFPIPRPTIREVFLPRRENSHDTPSPTTSEVPLHSQFSQTSTPLSLTSRRETPRKEPTPRTWLPGNKLSPTLVTPPLVEPAPKSQTPRELPSQPQSTPQQRLQSSPTLRSPTLTPPESTPTPPKPPPPQLQRRITPPTPIPMPMPMPMPTTPPTPFSTLTSDYDSDATTTSDETTTNSKSSSRTPTSVCLCRLCGKSQNATTATAAIYKNNNNPLYDIVSPMQSPSRMGGHVVATMGSHGGGPSRAWAWFLTLCEVVVWLVLAGLFTVKLMPFVESVFRAYVAGSCGGGNANRHGPHLTADGLKSGIENWVTCPVDAAGMSGRS